METFLLSIFQFSVKSTDLRGFVYVSRCSIRGALQLPRQSTQSVSVLAPVLPDAYRDKILATLALSVHRLVLTVINCNFDSSCLIIKTSSQNDFLSKLKCQAFRNLVAVLTLRKTFGILNVLGSYTKTLMLMKAEWLLYHKNH